jgi:hypothetical protein
MPFELVGYDVLKQAVKESIKTEIEAHHPDHAVNIDKLDESVPLLHVPRKTQAQWLLKVIALTDAMQQGNDVKKKPGILNAAVLHIRDQIYQTYRVGRAERSGFYQSLTASLGINQKNKPELRDEYNLFLQLKLFMMRATYKSGNPTSGYVDEPPLAIKDYDLEGDLTSLTRKVVELEVRCVADAKEHMSALKVEPAKAKDETVAQAPSRGLISSIFSSTPAAKPLSTIKEEHATAKPL